jgi:hypothetical protein
MKAEERAEKTTGRNILSVSSLVDKESGQEDTYSASCASFSILGICKFMTGVSSVQSAFYEKVPAGWCRLWCSAGGMCTGGWTKGLLLVENSMTHQGVTLLHTD